MIHTFIGNLGHASIILSFVTALVATYSYFQATRTSELEAPHWLRFARRAFFVHLASVLSIIFSLFFIIYNHYFEYHYAWSHSSRSLPSQYMISCFWEGQEGSFLLWIFWQAVLGILLIYSNKIWEAPVMAIFALVQAFLASMILGVVIPGLDLKIGSSPFMLMREVMQDAPVFKSNPNFVPEDGNGLNPLLQNYWMVIHPPTLFLGFATTLVPFAFCLAGLWQKKYSDWVRPALPWALFSGMVLGTGIIMGAIWAYETLNFGGYWNWDPVENAVYVPWLVLVAAIHTMLVYRKSETALKSSAILVIATFILILYSTFLTRSGILGSASVHSFTDLGLSGQLLIYLLTFVVIAVFFIIKSWKHLPSSEKEVSTYSREFWIFIGATVLCLAAFQVISTTSIPVYNKIAEAFGFVSNMAPPADQIGHYTKFQLWAGVLIAILSVLGQFFWWRKIQDGKTLVRMLSIPFLISLVLAIVVVEATDMVHGLSNYPVKIDGRFNPEFTSALLKYLTYFIVLAASIFSILSNGLVIWSVAKNNYKLAGGAVSHIGFALMLVGVLFSAGYSKVVSINSSGLLFPGEFFTRDNSRETKENILLRLNEPVQIDEYLVTYRGRRVEAIDVPGYLKPSFLAPGDAPHLAVAKEDIVQNGKLYHKKGDTLHISAENTYYEVEYRDEKGRVFSLYPRAQINEEMGGILASPDIKHSFGRDIYTHVSSVRDPSAETEWSKTEEVVAQIGDTLFFNDYVAVLDNVVRASDVEGVVLTSTDAAVKAHIRILGKERTYEVKPTFLIKDRMVGRVPEVVEDLGLQVTFLNVDPQKGAFTFGVNTTQKDWIIMKALEKPFINLLWIGTVVLLVGMTLSTVRRYNEFAKMRDKGAE